MAPRGLIFVSYYLRTVAEIQFILDSYDAAVRQRHREVLVVDNAGFLPLCTVAGDRHIEVIRGSNSSWEFSGWHEGIAYATRWPSSYNLTLLNDSYERNWTITKASRGIIDAMYCAADHGLIGGWLDNFSVFQRPRFSRKPNSRLVIVPGAGRELMASSLLGAIERCWAITNSAGELFNAVDCERVQSWIASQPGRWSPDTLPTRLQRIYLEHHMFDRVPRDCLQLYPKTYGGTLVYSAMRRLFREKR